MVGLAMNAIVWLPLLATLVAAVSLLLIGAETRFIRRILEASYSDSRLGREQWEGSQPQAPVAVRVSFAKSEVDSYGQLLAALGNFQTALEHAFSEYVGAAKSPRPQLAIAAIRNGSLILFISATVGAVLGTMTAVVTVVEFFKILKNSHDWLLSRTGRSPADLDAMPGEVSEARMREILKAARSLFRRGVVEVEIRIREGKGTHRFVLNRRGVDEALQTLSEGRQP